LQKRYSEADFVMKVAWKIALNILPKKMPFRVPKNLGEFNGKICSE
jgi:hypothetical protein